VLTLQRINLAKNDESIFLKKSEYKRVDNVKLKGIRNLMSINNIKILNEDPLFSREEAASYLGVKPKTLAMWKSTGRQELKFIKMGRLVKYKKSVLDAFILSKEGG
jgi:excisionase family DNA binding protein